MATTTKRLQAANGSFTTLNTGPCIIELQASGTMRIVVGTTTPASGELANHLISFPAGQFVYSGNETVYAQSDKSGSNPYVVITPIL